MNDEELCQLFGTTLDKVDADVEKFEHGDWSNFRFSAAVDGRPRAKMTTTSLKFFDFELAAIDRAAKSKGISRSEFIRRACDNELLTTA